jgi:hypothetical protein
MDSLITAAARALAANPGAFAAKAFDRAADGVLDAV